MSTANIPIKVNVTDANDGVGDDVTFHDLRIDDKGSLVLEVSVKVSSGSGEV